MSAALFSQKGAHLKNSIYRGYSFGNYTKKFYNAGNLAYSAILIL